MRVLASINYYGIIVYPVVWNVGGALAPIDLLDIPGVAERYQHFETRDMD